MCTVPDSASLLCNQWFSDQTEGQECTPCSTAENKASDTAFLSLPSSCVKEAVSRYVHLSTTASKWDQPPPKVGSAYNAWVSSLYWHHIGIMQTIRGIFRWSHSLPIFSHGFKEETAVKQWCWWFIYFFFLPLGNMVLSKQNAPRKGMSDLFCSCYISRPLEVVSISATEARKGVTHHLPNKQPFLAGWALFCTQNLPLKQWRNCV